MVYETMRGVQIDPEIIKRKQMETFSERETPQSYIEKPKPQTTGFMPDMSAVKVPNMEEPSPKKTPPKKTPPKSAVKKKPVSEHTSVVVSASKADSAPKADAKSEADEEL